MARTVRKIALMAVGDDGWQGGIQYISNILNALDAIAVDPHLEVHLLRHSRQNFRNLASLKNIRIIEHDTEKVFQPWSFPNKVKWKLQRKFQGRLNPRVEEYLLGLGVDFAFPSTLSYCGGKLNSAGWIADFQYHHFPNGARPDINADARRVIGRIAETSDKVVLSSLFCEQDCLQLFPITRGRTHVMPFAVAIPAEDLAFRDFGAIADHYLIPRRFLMVANIFAPTKDHATLFEALGILRAKGIEVPLICTGNIVDYRNEHFANEVLQMLTLHRIRSQVHLLGLVPRDHQLALFRMAVAIVQPSLNEGWSTSVEEAKALGKHLLVSDIPVHKEQCPDNPFMFPASQAKELADRIERVWIATAGTEFPELDKEAQAHLAYQEKVREFGHRFMEIASA